MGAEDYSTSNVFVAGRVRLLERDSAAHASLECLTLQMA
jgi:hypothetical protein